LQRCGAQVWQAIVWHFRKGKTCGGIAMMHFGIEPIMRFVVAAVAAPYVVKITLLILAAVAWSFD
jgi:hypothetical protein